LEVPINGAYSDLMWSDPDSNIETWSKSPRGAGFLFGQIVSQEVCLYVIIRRIFIFFIFVIFVVVKFTRINGLDLICRAHQLVMDGYKYAFPENHLVTVWFVEINIFFFFLLLVIYIIII
jgi:diadenosine tetraphosphatase ApaH/serine/threonine PP2A family protein phosphatase